MFKETFAALDEYNIETATQLLFCLQIIFNIVMRICITLLQCFMIFMLIYITFIILLFIFIYAFYIFIQVYNFITPDIFI